MVYILLGKGFEETEAIAPGDVLRRAQIPTQYVGIGGKVVEGAHGISVQADITASEMDLSQMDMLVLPGGLGGVESIEKSEEAVEAIIYALREDKFLGAICAAPTILGKRGCWTGGTRCAIPAARRRWQSHRASGQGDGGGRKPHHRPAPGAAIEFGLTLAGLLKGQFTPDEIAGYMVYERR